MDNTEVEVISLEDSIAETLADIEARDGPIANARTTSSRGERDDKPAAEESKPVEAVAEEESAPESEPTEPEAKNLDRAPSSWKPAAKLEWNALPPSIKAEIARRESDYFRGFEQIRPDADMGKTMREAAEPYKALIEQAGGSVEGAFKDYLNVNAVLRQGSPQQKQQVLLQIAQQFGIQIPGSQGGQIPQADPNLTEVQQFMQEQRRRDAEAAQQREQQATQTVEKWVAEVNPQGMPLRPFVDNVLEEMMGKVPALKAANPGWSHQQVLQEAYDRAVWENPETRKTLLDRQTQAQKAETDKLRATQEAKRSASVNVRRRGSLPGAAPTGSMDDTLRETYRQLVGT